MSESNPISKNNVISLVRKKDGKRINVTIHDIFKNLPNADFINNEIRINGEIYFADSYGEPYYEVRINVIVKSFNDGHGTFTVNDISYNTNQSFTVQKNSPFQIILFPDASSYLKSVHNESNVELTPINNIVDIPTDANHAITIEFQTNKQTL